MKKILFSLMAAGTLIFSCRTQDSPEPPNYRFDIEDTPAYVVNSSLPFSRGLNFTTWFEASSPRAIIFNKYTEQEFKNVKDMDIDVIRLPINLHSMTGPDYSLFLQFLDTAVDWAEKHEIYLILDNHSFDPVKATAVDIDTILIPVWTQMAEHYKNRSKYILYEILNEPHGIDAKKWAEIQEKVVSAIRAIDSEHYIIVGGVDYNSIDKLFDLPQYNFNNIIYTFHFYDPYLFTHQGETWGSPPNLRTLKGMPFPADAHAIPPISSELKGTWVDQSIRSSYRQDAAVKAMAKQLDKAAQFSKERSDVPLLCGEFGVYIPNSLPEDRLRWYQAAAKLLDNRRIARTSWDYYGGFGIFNTDKGGSFESDLNVDIVKAMGFNAPPQKTAELIREAFTIFDNYPMVGINSWACSLDLYYQNGEKYALSWGDADQYGNLSFIFQQKIDWEYLKSNGYAVTLKVRTNKDAQFDLRFLNPEDASSIPWRTRSQIDIKAGQWHTLRLPLAEMREHGAWINSKQEWRGPEGKFSWAQIVSLDIVAEEHDLKGVTLLFDTIMIEK